MIRKAVDIEQKKLILGDRDKIYGWGLTKDKPNNHDNHDNHDNYSYNLANSLTERLKLLVLETKAELDGLYNEMLNISKQLLSMNIINQKQLDNFVFNYDKLAKL